MAARPQVVTAGVFDAARGARTDDAVVTAKVGERGLTAAQARLEPMLIAGAMGYGNLRAFAAGPVSDRTPHRPVARRQADHHQLLYASPR
jgi:hypothetical protein